MITSGRADDRLSFLISIEPGNKQSLEVPIGKVDPALMIARQDHSISCSDYKSAAMNVLHWSVATTSRIFVTSPKPGDGKTCTAFNIAWTLAESGRRVLLVELNFSKPGFRAALGNLRLRYGLENAMRGLVEPADAVFSVASTGLHIAAMRNATPARELQPVLKHLDAFLDWGSQHYEVLVIDCPSVLSSEWNSWFSKFVGPTLLVVREDHTSVVDVRRAVKLLGLHLKGVLLNASRRNSVYMTTSITEERIGSGPREGQAFEQQIATSTTALRRGS
jgi:Mrp family chromosome partitioning ATPase